MSKTQAKNESSEIKDLKMKMKVMREEMLKLRVEKTEAVNRMSNIINLNTIRKEIQKADDFIRSILKENLISFEESVMNKKVNELTITGKSKVSKLQDKEVSMYGCNCSECATMRALSKVKISDRSSHSSVSREFLISKNVVLQTIFSSDEFNIVNNTADDNRKLIKFKHKIYKNSDIMLNFILKKTKESNPEDYNFSEHRFMDMTIDETDEKFKVSFSAIMVVEAFRAMREEKETELFMMKMDEAVVINSCFKEWVSKFIMVELDSRKVNRISDLSYKEEVVLLTSVGLDEVFVYVNETDSKENHISETFFEKSIKMKAYMLFTPMFRDINFYVNNKDSRFEVVDEFPEWEELNMEHVNELVDHPLNNSTSGSSDSSPKLTRINSKSMVLDNKITSSENKFFNDNMFFGTTSEFVDKRMEERLKSEYMDINMMNTIRKSKFMYTMFENMDDNADVVYALNMSPTEFKACAFFFGQTTDFYMFLMMADMKNMSLMPGKMEAMFYKYIYDSRNKESYKNQFLKFLEDVSMMEEFKVVSMDKMFKMFKMRLFMLLYVKDIAKKENFKINEMYNSLRLENFNSSFLGDRWFMKEKMNTKKIDTLANDNTMMTLSYEKHFLTNEMGLDNNRLQMNMKNESKLLEFLKEKMIHL